MLVASLLQAPALDLRCRRGVCVLHMPGEGLVLLSVTRDYFSAECGPVAVTEKPYLACNFTVAVRRYKNNKVLQLSCDYILLYTLVHAA